MQLVIFWMLLRIIAGVTIGHVTGPHAQGGPSQEAILRASVLRFQLGTSVEEGSGYTFHAWDSSGSDPQCQGSVVTGPRDGGSCILACALDGGLEWLIYRIYFQSVVGSTHVAHAQNR